jgi:diguanylate cyclase (GGDEF)-like protein
MKAPLLVRIQFAITLIATSAVIAYCIDTGWSIIGGHWYYVLVFAAAESASISLPIVITHSGTRTEYSAGGMVFVASALLLPTPVATLVLFVGDLAGYAIHGKLRFLRTLDACGNAVCVFVAFTIAHLIGPVGLTLSSVAGAVVGALVWDVTTLLLVAVTASFRAPYQTKEKEPMRFWTFVRVALAGDLPMWPWLWSIGILLGAMGTTIPWALPLMAAPLALVFLASRARVEATEDRTRLDGLLGATSAILAATSVAAVIETATTNAAALLAVKDGRVDSEPSAEGELSVPFVCERLGAQYLIVAARDVLALRYTEQDRRMLETLASITASALDKAASHEDVAEQATRDALTGLVNRRAFEEELKAAAIGKRSTDASGVMFLDLDGFKKINDEHGHKAGDEVLVETAKRLLQSVRGGDTVARLGGDEFTVLLRGVHDKDEAAIVAERILTAMRRPMKLSTGIEVHPTPSLGIALAAGPDTDPNTLLKEADAAMYEAKRAGKDCWRLANGGVTTVVGQ